MSDTRRTGQFWLCGQCGKHVPARQLHCACGGARSAANASVETKQPRAEVSAPTSPGRAWVWPLVFVLIGTGALVMQRRAHEEERRQDQDRLRVAEARALDAERQRTIVLDAKESIPSESVPEYSAASIAPTPALAPEETPVTETLAATTVQMVLPASPLPVEPALSAMDEQRAKADELFRPRLDALARRANLLDANFRRYLDACYLKYTHSESTGASSGAAYGREWFTIWSGRSRFAWQESWSGQTVTSNETTAPCRILWSDIVADAGAVRRELSDVDDDARRASVIPGVMRDLRRQYRLSWE